jgi:DNA repair protein RadC
VPARIYLHDCPSGDPTPAHADNSADIQMAKQIIAVASLLGIAAHHHIIVGKEGHTRKATPV